LKPTPNTVVRTAVLDGVPIDRPDGSVGAFERRDGLLLVSEAAFLNRTANGDRTAKVRYRIGRSSGLPPYEDKVAVGGWYYTSTFSDLDTIDSNGEPRHHRGSSGVYVLGDAGLWRSKRLQDDGSEVLWKPGSAMDGSIARVLLRFWSRCQRTAFDATGR